MSFWTNLGKALTRRPTAFNLAKVTRIVVIEKNTGRVYEKWGVMLSLIKQDNGRTLKIIVEEDPNG